MMRMPNTPQRPQTPHSDITQYPPGEDEVLWGNLLIVQGLEGQGGLPRPLRQGHTQQVL
jgi:hypothetical protein